MHCSVFINFNGQNPIVQIGLTAIQYKKKILIHISIKRAMPKCQGVIFIIPFQVVMICWLLPLLLTIDVATFEVNMTRYSKKQLQRQLAVPPHKQTLLRNTFMEEKHFLDNFIKLYQTSDFIYKSMTAQQF